MTWTKTGDEFGDELANAGIGDAAYRTHHEAVTWLYRLEKTDLRIPKHLVRRFAGSPDHEIAIKELIGARLWRDRDDCWEVVHHGEVIRQSIRQQRDHRERNRKAQRAYRGRKTDPHKGAGVSDDVSAYVSDDVTGNTDRQTDSFPTGAEARDGGAA